MLTCPMINETGPAAAWKYPIKTFFYPLETAGKIVGIDAGVIAARNGENLPTILRRGAIQFISPLGSRAKLDYLYSDSSFFDSKFGLSRPVGSDDPNSFSHTMLEALDAAAQFVIGSTILHEFFLHPQTNLVDVLLATAAIKGIYNAVTNVSTDLANGGYTSSRFKYFKLFSVMGIL